MELCYSWSFRICWNQGQILKPGLKYRFKSYTKQCLNKNYLFSSNMGCLKVPLIPVKAFRVNISTHIAGPKNWAKNIAGKAGFLDTPVQPLYNIHDRSMVIRICHNKNWNPHDCGLLDGVSYKKQTQYFLYILSFFKTKFHRYFYPHFTRFIPFCSRTKSPFFHSF